MIMSIIEKNKEPFLAMINQYLDSLYNQMENNPAASDYEEVRRKIIDGKELTQVQENLILILVVFYRIKFENLINEYTIVVEEFSKIEFEIKNILFPNLDISKKL